MPFFVIFARMKKLIPLEYIVPFKPYTTKDAQDVNISDNISRLLDKGILERVHVAAQSDGTFKLTKYQVIIIALVLLRKSFFDDGEFHCSIKNMGRNWEVPCFVDYNLIMPKEEDSLFCGQADLPSLRVDDNEPIPTPNKNQPDTYH